MGLEVHTRSALLEYIIFPQDPHHSQRLSTERLLEIHDKKIRDLIKERDGHRCQLKGCVSPKDKIDAHHILPVSLKSGRTGLSEEFYVKPLYHELSRLMNAVPSLEQEVFWENFRHLVNHPFNHVTLCRQDHAKLHSGKLSPLKTILVGNRDHPERPYALAEPQVTAFLRGVFNLAYQQTLTPEHVDPAYWYQYVS